MASNYISPISMDALSNLCQELGKNNYINAHDFERYQVKRGLRNSDGTGVMAGLTRICSVEGYYILDGERIPTDGKLSYRGYDIRDLVDNCIAEDRFGYEEVVWLLLFGNLPTANQLYSLREVLSECRALPDEFVEDVIMKHASKDIMNKMARCILSLYSFDENPDDTSIPNVLRQSLQLIAQTPTIMNSAYQIKRRTFYNKTMFLHPINKEQTMAEYILNQLRVDKTFTREEAKLLDICLMLHADHGGGNNSTFSTRVLTSSGTDTYSAITAGFGSLKGPRHGGANIRVTHMMEDIIAHVADPTKPEQVKDYLYIQNIRFEDRIEIIMDEIPESIMQIKIAPMILQPLAENAYQHGLKNIASGGIIHISAGYENGYLWFQVEDNGDGISPKQLSELKQRLERGEINKEEIHGLTNVQARISLLYGSESGLTVNDGTEGGFCVKLRIAVPENG